LTFAARLAAHFHSRPNQFIDGLELAKIGGVYAYRTRLSELRRAPFNMVIENRQRRMFTGTVISEYRFVPAPASLLEIAEQEQVNA